MLITDAKLGAGLVAAAEAAGHEFDVCAGEAEAWDACEERTELLLVDASGEAADAVRPVDSMRAGGELAGVRTVAVHADADPAAKGPRGGGRLRPRARAFAHGGQRGPTVRGRLLA